jgi:hypothetical protein
MRLRTDWPWAVWRAPGILHIPSHIQFPKMHEPIRIRLPWVYSIFGIGVERKHTLKWLSLEKKPPFSTLTKSTCIPKML